MTEKTNTVIRWQHKTPDDPDDETGGGIPSEEDPDGNAAGIDLELLDEFDMIGYCTGARRVILARVNPENLNYSQTMTFGTITEGAKGDINTENKEVKFTDTDTASLGYVPKDFSYSWVRPVISVNGDHLDTPPSASVEGTNIVLSFKIGYGIMKVTYKSAAYRHIVEIEQDSTAIFTWSGGVADIDVPLPDMECTTEIDPEDKYECYKRIVYVDPCTGEITSDSTQQMSCSEQEFHSCSQRSDAG